MRLNISKYQEMMEQQNIGKEDITRMTGITERTLNWIWENEYLEAGTLERLADVIGCRAQEITLPDHNNMENVIEWVRDGKTATVSLTQGRYVSRIRRLAKRNPEECQIIAENKDGSICAHVPVNWIRINPRKELTDKERERLSEHARNVLNNSSN